METLCPQCERVMHWQNGEYHCNACQRVWQKFVLCPDCEAELEKLQACGSASHFCPQCNELKSSSRLSPQWRLVSEA